MDAGVALFDYDNDGRLDIFLVNGAPNRRPDAQRDSSEQDWVTILESGCSTRSPTERSKK
jgi:hypothetical protein